MSEPTNDEPKMFPEEYVKELRDENAQRRLAEKTAKDQLAQVRDALGIPKETGDADVIALIAHLRNRSEANRNLAIETLTRAEFERAAAELDVIDADAAWRLAVLDDIHYPLGSPLGVDASIAFQVYGEGELVEGTTEPRAMLATEADALAWIEVIAIASHLVTVDQRNVIARTLGRRVRLTWPASTSSDVAAYRVFHDNALGAGVNYETVIAEIDAKPGGVALSEYAWTSGELDAGAWTFGIRAVDAAGNVQTSPTREVTKTIATVPDPASDLELSYDAGSHTVTLTWTEPERWVSGRRVLVLFRGRISDVVASFDADDETVRLTALGPRRMLDAGDVRGCVHADPSGSGVVETDEAVVFNRDGVGNLDETDSYSDDADYPLFADAAAVADDDNPSWLGYWRLKDAWNYLLARHCPEGEARRPTGENSFPLPDEKNPVLPPTDVDGMPPSRAIDRLLSTFGLDWWVDPVTIVTLDDEPSLDTLPVFRVLSPDDGPVKSLKLAAAGSTFDPSTTNVEAGSLSASTRPTINHWIIEGDFVEHEAAFELTALWTDGEEGELADDPDKANRASADYDPSLDHVWRQWGLNEDAHWDDRAAFSFDDLFGEGRWVRRRRRFLPPYTAPGEDARRIVVELKTGELPTWHRVASGSVRLLTDRAGIYFDLADVEGSASRLRLEDGESVALNEITEVRLTAVVQSDERVTHEAGKSETSGSALTFTQTLRRSDFRKVVRDDSSVFAPDGTGTIRDDSSADGPMAKLVIECREHREPLQENVTVTMPWVHLGYRAGDRIESVSGRDLSLFRKPGVEGELPWVRKVMLSFSAQRTILTL